MTVWMGNLHFAQCNIGCSTESHTQHQWLVAYVVAVAEQLHLQYSSIPGNSFPSVHGQSGTEITEMVIADPLGSAVVACPRSVTAKLCADLGV